jgi:branched-chain amino acid transport system substrate-binding protein
VQALVGCGFGAVTAITARNYKQLGMEKTPFYFNHGVGSQQFIDGAGGGAEGVRVPVAALIVADQLPDSDPQKKLALEYQKAYRDAYKEPISTFGGHAYDALMIAVEAITRAGGTDAAKVRDEIEKTKNFLGVDGIFNMTPTDHLGITLESFKMVEVRGGAWKLLD